MNPFIIPSPDDKPMYDRFFVARCGRLFFEWRMDTKDIATFLMAKESDVYRAVGEYRESVRAGVARMTA